MHDMNAACVWGTVLHGAIFFGAFTPNIALTMVLHWTVVGAAEGDGPPTLNSEMARFMTPCTACRTPVLLFNTCPGCGRRVSRGSRDESVPGGISRCHYPLPSDGLRQAAVGLQRHNLP